MKYSHFLLGATICCLLFSSCGNNTTRQNSDSDKNIVSEGSTVTNENKIREYVQYLGRTFATKDGMFQNIRGLDYQDKAMIIKIETNSDFIKPSAIKENQEIEKKELLAKFKYQIWKGDTAFQNSLRNLADLGIYGEIRYFSSKNPNTQATVYLSTIDLQEVADYTGDPTQEVLEAQVNALNIHLPVQADYCTIMDKMSISDGYLTYDYTIIEDEVPLSYFKENISLVKENLRQKLFAQCDNDLMHQAKRQGLGSRYRYKGDKNNKKSFSITFENSELK